MLAIKRYYKVEQVTLICTCNKTTTPNTQCYLTWNLWHIFGRSVHWILYADIDGDRWSQATVVNKKPDY